MIVREQSLKKRRQRHVPKLVIESNTKVKCLCMALIMLYALSGIWGCAGRKHPRALLESSYMVGVIDSDNYENGTTYCYLYDEDMQKVDTVECPYFGLGSYGGTPVQIVNGKLYEASVGNINEYNNCAVVAMDLQTGQWKSYSFAKPGGMHDFRVNENGIYTLSNLDGVSYIGYYSFQENKEITIEVQNAPGISLSVNGYDAYFVAEKISENGKKFLYHVNVKEQSQEEILDVTEALEENILSYTQWYQGKMYIPNGRVLSIYDSEKNQIQHIALPGKYACQILLDQEQMYIVDCDADNEGETDIYKFNPEKEEIELTYHLQEMAMQSVIQDEFLYTLGQWPDSTIRKYELSSDGMCKKLKETVIESQEDDFHMISDFFVK